MPTAFIDLTNDFQVEKEWFRVPTTDPHWTKISPEDPLAPDKADYIWANSIGVRDRFGLQNLSAGFGPVGSFIYQFAYNGLNADNTVGALLEFLIAPGVVVATAGPLKLNSLGADTAGQVTFTFSPALTEAEFNTGSVRHTSADSPGGGEPDPPVFQE